jgi:hypothetical protein
MRHALEGLGFLVGRWEGKFETFPEAHGARAGSTSGEMAVSWGAGRAWLTVEARMALPGLGSYGVGITIAADPGGDGLLAFVVNTLGAATLYRGQLQEPGSVEFLGRPARHQRVSYTLRTGGGLLFSVEESEDGEEWIRHSTALLHPVTEG